MPRQTPDAVHPAALRLTPRQRRSREIVGAILEAGRELLHGAGPEPVTTQRIADRAGVSIGSLYRYFPNKEAIFAALYDGELAEEAIALGEKLERLREHDPGHEPHADLRDFLGQVVDLQLDRHRRLLALHGDYYRRHHREFSVAKQLGRSEVETAIEEKLAEHADELGVTDLREAAFLISRGISAIVRVAVEERPEKLEQRAFRDELVAMLTRYVALPAPRDPARPPRPGGRTADR